MTSQTYMNLKTLWVYHRYTSEHCEWRQGGVPGGFQVFAPNGYHRGVPEEHFRVEIVHDYAHSETL